MHLKEKKKKPRKVNPTRSDTRPRTAYVYGQMPSVAPPQPSPKVAHSPRPWPMRQNPKSTPRERMKKIHVSLCPRSEPGRCHRYIDKSTRETKFIPTFQHLTPILQPAIRRELHQYTQLSCLVVSASGRTTPCRSPPCVPDVDRSPVQSRLGQNVRLSTSNSSENTKS